MQHAVAHTWNTCNSRRANLVGARPSSCCDPGADRGCHRGLVRVNSRHLHLIQITGLSVNDKLRSRPLSHDPSSPTALKWVVVWCLPHCDAAGRMLPTFGSMLGMAAPQRTKPALSDQQAAAVAASTAALLCSPVLSSQQAATLPQTRCIARAADHCGCVPMRPWQRIKSQPGTNTG